MLICAKTEMNKIRTLITSIEFEMTPPAKCDVLTFKPDRQDIMLKLFHIRNATIEIEKAMLKEFPLP